jgi:translation initiation factor IF-2
MRERDNARASLETARTANRVLAATAQDMARERDEARNAAHRALEIAEEQIKISADLAAEVEALQQSLRYARTALELAVVVS